MQTTAKIVKGNIQSLLAKANAETGKEHKSLSEAFEDLALGYGIGAGEAFDGSIELYGGPDAEEPTVVDYFEEGKKAGVAELEDFEEVVF